MIKMELLSIHNYDKDLVKHFKWKAPQVETIQFDRNSGHV